MTPNTHRSIWIALAGLLALAGSSGAVTAAQAADRAPAAIIAAEAAYQAGQYQRVIDRLIAARLHRAHDGAARAMLLCQTYLKLDAPSPALDACDAAVQSGIYGWAALNNRGVAYFHLGRTGAAMADFERARRLAPAGSSAAHNYRTASERLAADPVRVAENQK